MYPYLTGKYFPFTMGNVSPSHWEKFPPFKFNCSPFLSVNVFFPNGKGKSFPSHWEIFFFPVEKVFFSLSRRETGKRFHILQGYVSLFQRESLIIPVGNVCTSSFPMGNVPSSLPTALKMFLLSSEKALIYS